ncbi:hypothetical protein [Lacrimispora indolis]|uniref:hypothetical protein n=1 Tax=Lacrimispora indolis TaxID=69825 RepID=UPI000462DA1D|nr:hypothetical protein [[Clostridium] methoxybenzovorans]
MEFRIISLPPFKASTSGVSNECDFAPGSILNKFDKYFSAIKLCPRDSFRPRDFLYFDNEKQGMVWMWALSEDIDDGGNEVINFDGGYYLTYAYKDGDEETNGKLYREAINFIVNSKILELDIRSNHYAMGHIITPQEIIIAQGWAQMETFIPVKLKNI